MNLNPILITQILNLASEINLKQSQLNFLIHKVFGPSTHQNGFGSYQQMDTYTPPQHSNQFNPSEKNDFYEASPEKFQKWEMPTTTQSPSKSTFDQRMSFSNSPSQQQREPVNAKYFDIEPVYQLALSRKFPKTFEMSPKGLVSAKHAGVLQVQTEDYNDKFTFIRVRGSYTQPTIQIVVLDTDWEIIESYLYSFSGRVKDGIVDEWELIKRLEDYKVDNLQVQQDFFKGYPQYAQPLPKD